MKSYLFNINLSLLLVLTAGFSFGQNANNIKFDKEVQKFDKVDEGIIIELTYSFTYTGSQVLSIIPPKIDCSCTQVILPEKSITPNSTNIVKIKFDTKNKIGYQEREVVLHFVSDGMDSVSIEKKLIFKGVVKASKTTKELYRKNYK